MASLNDLYTKYGKNLTEKQKKELAEREKRYKLLNSGLRADAGRTIAERFRNARRGLQNMGLAGREGKQISGQEGAIREGLQAQYDAYNRQLRGVEEAYTERAAAQMANETQRQRYLAELKKQQEAANAEAERIKAEYEAAVAAARRAAQEQAAQEQAAPQGLNAVRDTIKSAGLAALQHGIETYDPMKHGTAENLSYFRLVAKQNGMRTVEANQYAAQMAADVANRKNQASSLLKPRSRISDEQIQKSIENNTTLRFSREYGVSTAKLRTEDPAFAGELERRTKAIYSDFDAKVEQWQKDIQAGDEAREANKTNPLSPRDSVGKGKRSEAIRKADVARREMAASYSERARLALAVEAPKESRYLYTMDDSQFAVAYDAAERLYKAAEKEAKAAEGDFKRNDQSAYAYKRKQEADDKLRKATESFTAFEQAKAKRTAVNQEAAYAETFSIPDEAQTTDIVPEGSAKGEAIDSMTSFVFWNQQGWSAVPWAKRGEWNGSNWKEAYNRKWDADDYAKTHDTNGSRFSALVNEWSFINGRTALLYTQTFQLPQEVANVGEWIGTIFGGDINRDHAYTWFRNRCVMTFKNDYETSGTKADKEQMDAYLTLANLMTDEERARFNAICEKAGGKQADEYFEYLYENVLPARFQQYVSDELEFDTRDVTIKGLPDATNKIKHSLLSVPVNLTQSIPGVVHTLSTEQDDPIAAQLGAMQYTTAQGMRNAVSQEFSPLGRFAYQTGMSMADSATVALISSGIGNALQGLGVAANIAGKAGSLIGGSLLGGSAFNSAYEEGLQRGLTPEKARLSAVGTGVNEMLFETVSLDLLVGHFQKGGILKVSKKAWVNWVVNTMVQGGVEGSEEVFTDLANRWWDNQVNGIYSEELTKLREYMADGMSYGEAKTKVNLEFAGQLGLSFLGGALSGGIMGGGSTFLGMIQNRSVEKLGADIRTDTAHLNELRNFDYKSEQAQEILQQKNLTDMDIGVLEIIRTQELLQQSDEYIQKAVQNGQMPQEIAQAFKEFMNDPMSITDEQAEKMLPYTDVLKDAVAIREGLGKVAEQQKAARAEFDALPEAEKQKRMQGIQSEATSLWNAPSMRVGSHEGRASTKYSADLKIEGTKVKTQRGSVTFDFSTISKSNELTDNQARALRFASAVANKSGVNVKVEGEFIGYRRNQNGYYDPKTNTIHVNLNGTNSVVWTLSHELTHYLKEKNAQAYNDLLNEIKRQLSRYDIRGEELPTEYQNALAEYMTGENTVFDALCEYEKARYEKDGIKITDAQAEEEVTARCCESFLENSAFVNEMCSKHEKSARAIYRFLADIYTDIGALRMEARDRMAAQGYASDTSIENDILQQIADVETIMRLWDKGLREVANKRRKVQKQQEAAERASLSERIRLTENDETRTYELGDTKARVDGKDVSLEGGTVKQRVKMMDAVAELNGVARVEASSAEEAEAFRKAGAEQLPEEYGGKRSKYGTWEFKYEERQYEKDSRFDQKQKQKFATDILKTVGARRGFTSEQVVKYRAELARLMGYMWSAVYGKADGRVAWDYAERLFDRILDDYTELTEADEDFRGELLGELEQTKDSAGRTMYVLKVNETQMQEIKSEYENTRTYAAKLSKALGARVSVYFVHGATMLEDVFSYSTDSRINEDTNEGDMPRELLKVAEQTAAQKVHPYKGNSEERQAMKDDMFETAMTAIGFEKSTKQKIREAVKAARTEERAKAKVRQKEAVEKARLAEKINAGAVREKIRREEQAKVEETTRRERENQIKGEIVRMTKRNYEKLVQMLTNPTDASHVPIQLARAVSEYALALGDILDADMRKKADHLGETVKSPHGVLNTEKLIRAYEQTFATQDTIDAARAENPNYDPRGAVLDRDSSYDQHLVNMMQALNEVMKAKTVKQMDEYELRMLLSTVQGVLHTVYDANKMVGQSERRTVYEVGDKMAQELRDAPNVYGEKKILLTQLLNKYTMEILGLRRIAKIYSGSNENAEFVKLVDQLNDGALKKEQIAMRLRGMFDKVMQKYGKEVRKWYGRKAEWIDTGLVRNGKNVKITKGMRVSLAMHILNAQNLRNIEEAGLKIPDAHYYKHGKYKTAYTNGMTVRMTKAEAQRIVSQMTEAEKAYFEVAKELFHKRAAYYINETSLQLLGYPKATVPNYFPIQTYNAYRQSKTDFDATMRDAAIERPGFLEARNDVLSIMYLNDITSVVNRQINGVARYAGLAIPLHNWHAVMNQKLYADEGGKWRIQSTVRETLDQQTKLEREGGQDLIDGFIEAVKEIPKREYQDLPAKLGAKLTANYVKAVLLMNIRVALTQAASYPTAAAVVPWRYLGAAFKGHIEGHLNHANIDALIDQYTPIFAMRRAGTQNEVSEIMRRRGLSDMAEQKLPGLLGWITFMDTITTRRLWYACEQWVAHEQKNLSVGSDDYYKAVAKLYEKTIQETQPNFTPLQRAQVLRSGSAFTRLFAMFSTQLMQNGGIVIEKTFELAQAQGKDAKLKAARGLGRSLAGLIAAAMVVAIQRALSNAARGRTRPMQDEDGKVTWDSVDDYLRDEFFSSLAGSFLFGGQIYDIVSGAFSEAWNGNDVSLSMPAADAYETIAGFVRDLISGDGYMEYMQSEDHTDFEKEQRTKKFIIRATTALSYLTGLPMQNAAKTIINGVIPAWKDHMDYIKTGEFPQLWLHQSGRLDKETTHRNYTEWTDMGKPGSVYLYWEDRLNKVEGGRSKEAETLMPVKDLSPEEKALLLRMHNKGTRNDGAIVYNDNDEVVADFTNLDTFRASQLGDKKYQGFKKLVSLGISEEYAVMAFSKYTHLKEKGGTGEDESATEKFREWIMQTFSDPKQRAIVEQCVLGKTAQDGIVFTDSGKVTADYTSDDAYRASQLGDAKYKYYKKALEYGMNGTDAVYAMEKYAEIDKENRSDGEDDGSSKAIFREWLFDAYKNANDRAILDASISDKDLTVKNGKTYDDLGMYHDYSSPAWYELTSGSRSKDGTYKRYEAAKQLEKMGITPERTVELYRGLKGKSTKSEWKDYLTGQGLTKDQVTVILNARGWKW